MTQVRLLYIFNNPIYGGAHVQLLRLREPLAERGVETLALTTDEPASGQDRLRESGVDVTAIPLHRLRATPDPRIQLPFLASFRREVTAIRRFIRVRGVDVVQVHGPTNAHGAIAAAREGAAVVWQIYDTVAPMPLRRVTMPLVTRVADAITCWGRALAEEHPGALSLRERCIVVFPPVDVAEFRYDERRRATARAELGLPDDAFAIGTVGNRNPAKGHDLLIEAAAALVARRPGVHFRVLGASSPAHATFETGLHERVAALGLGDRLRFIDPGTRVADLVGGLDLFTMTSPPRSEGMPTAMLEAMAAGLPVVSTDVAAVRELVKVGETGLLVPPLDPRALADAYDRVAADAALRTGLGGAGLRRAETHFSLDALADLHHRAHRLALQHRDSR